MLVLALNCSSPKKTTEVTPEAASKATTAKVAEPKDPKDELIVVLKNAKSSNDVKALIKNSGLTWSKTAYDTKATQKGVVKVPEDKRDFWEKKLQETGEFRLVSKNSKKQLNEIIEKEKNRLISIRKTNCFGECPVYEITIDKNGNVAYNGEQFVMEKGKRVFKLSKEELEKLNKKLSSKDFESFNDVYDNPRVMDLPSTYITYKEKQIQIRLWNNIPAELVDVHEYVEGLLLERKYIE